MKELQLIPMLVITPLVFLGGSFYTIDMLPPAWRTASLFNPVVYLVSGSAGVFTRLPTFRVEVSLFMVMLFTGICLLIIWWIFKTGYRLKQ